MKTLTYAVLTVVATAGLSVAAITQAKANDVNCNSISFSSKAGGNAKASGCSHRGAGEKTRLRAQCAYSPFNAYSPERTGSFTNVSFTTANCAWGVNRAGIQHNY